MTINRLMTAVVQMQDEDAAIDALEKAGFAVSPMASSGGFLGSRNSTLLIGLSAGNEDRVLHILGEVCRRRVEYVATPLEGAPFHLPLTTPVTVGGATVFTLEVERYEVLE
jgi:uncharacterized protein YaaQ